MEALLAAGIPARFAAVVSNRPDARGLAIAAGFGVPTAVVDHQAYSERRDFDAALRGVIDRHSPDLVVLAGFMRVLGDDFVRHYRGRLMNIHPSLLPLFPGLNTHRRALEAGVKIHGCTVHFVTPDLDSGPIVIQAAVPVLEQDDEEALAARVLAQEHRIYPQAVRWFISQRLRLTEDGRVSVVAPGQREGALIAPALESGPRSHGAVER